MKCVISLCFSLTLIGLTDSDIVQDCPAINGENVQDIFLTLPSVTVPQDEDTYYGKAFNLPSAQDYDVIAIQPFLTNPNIIYHMAVYLCSDDKDISRYDEAATLDIFGVCSHVMYVWTKGSGDVCLPDNVGIRIGQSGFKKVLLEVHMHNPDGTPGLQDSSGVVIYTQPQQRELSAGSFLGQVGYKAIPPNMGPGEETTVTGTWSRECTRNLEGPIYIMSAAVFMRQLGSSATLSQFRNGQKIRDLVVVENYDPNNPPTVSFVEPFVLQPGEDLKITCVYDSRGRQEYTYLGEQAKTESCTSVITYYPYRDIPLYLTFGDSVDCAMQSAGCDTTEFFASGLENFINTIRQNCPRSDLSGETCSEDCKTLIEDEYKKPCYSGDRMYWAAEMFRLKERSLNLQVGQTQYQDQSAFNALATCNTMYFDPETTDSAQDSNSVVRTGSSGSEHLSICYIFVAITSLAGIFTI